MSDVRGDGALSGTVVVDLTRGLSGPYCTMLLADMGARVIKVESKIGDLIRAEGPFAKDDSVRAYGGYFQSLNRNKESLSIDFRTPEGIELIRKLALRADVVVENFRAGVMDSMGLSYESLSEANPALVYGCVRGFGDPRTGTSPHADRPAFDVVVQAMGGLMGITGQDADHPMKVGAGVGDIFPGTLATVGILAAMHKAQRTGRGDFIDVAMYDAIVSLCERIVYLESYVDMVSAPVGNGHPILCPFGLFKAADGWISIAAPRPGQWRVLCEAMGQQDWIEDDRYRTNTVRAEHSTEVMARVEEWTSGLTTTEVIDAISNSVPCGPVQTVTDILADPHMRSRNMIVELEQPGSSPKRVAGSPIKFAGSSGLQFQRAPFLGEHSEAVLAEVGGLSPVEIDALVTGGLVHQHP